MIRINYLLPVLCSLLLLTNCKDDDKSEITPTSATPTKVTPKPNSKNLLNNEIKEFIYNGLNQVYLYKDDAPDLANDRFNNNTEKTKFINNGGSPEAFFEKLTIRKDRFSWIVDDFNELERNFEGTTLSSGLKFYIVPFSNESNERFIAIYDIVKDSPADKKGIKRGMFFDRINGSQINLNNQEQLFTDNSYTLSEAIIDASNTLVPTNNTFEINKVELTENPIAISKIITVGINKIAYLQYNQFIDNFDEELNNVFGTFKNAGITDLVLDLRYNGGGDVASADALMGMITGNLENEILGKSRFNKDLNSQIELEDRLFRFSNTTFAEKTPLNSLGLNKFYVITSKEQTASASELVINGLKPYIDVIVIGDERGTVGKSQGSRTIYDSPTFFSKENVNTKHTYAMQPLISELVNKNDIRVDPITGILPDLIASESLINLGILGDENEPLLKIAIDDITGRNTPSAKVLDFPFGEIVGNEAMRNPTYQRMYFTN